MRLHLPRRRIWRGPIYFISFLLILIAVDLVWASARRTIHPGYDTTRIMGPLLPDGSIDYLSALEERFSRGVTPQNNAAVPMLAALGRAALPRSQPPDGITDRLGMAPLPEKGDYFVAFSDFFHGNEGNGQFDPIDRDRPLAMPDKFDPKLTEWVKTNEKPLALIAEASKRPRFFIPFNGGNRPAMIVSVLLPHARLMRESQRALLTRALMRLDEGDAAGFAADVGVLHRLARLITQDSTIIVRLIGIDVESAACRAERLALTSGKLSPDQQRALLSDLTALGEQPSMADCIDVGERFMAIDVFQVLARSNFHDRGAMLEGISDSRIPWAAGLLPIAYNDCMKSINRCNDGILAAMRQPTWAEQMQALDLLEKGLNETVSHSTLKFLSADWPATLFTPSVKKCNTMLQSARAQDRLTAASLALSIYKSDHGDWPQSLSDLTPAYLPATPIDPFSDRPLIYSRTAKGYALYSVGPDMNDDGGKGDDIGVMVP